MCIRDRLYGIDFNTDSLVIQNPPNDGTLTTLGPLLGIDTSDLVGFDIQSRSGTAFASLTAPFSPFSQLYTIDLDDLDVHLIGTIAGLPPVRDIAGSLGLQLSPIHI